MCLVRVHVEGLKEIHSVKVALGKKGGVSNGGREVSQLSKKLNRNRWEPLKVLFCLSSTADQWMSSALEKQAFTKALQIEFRRLSTLPPATCCHSSTASNIYLLFSMIYAKGPVTPP